MWRSILPVFIAAQELRWQRKLISLLSLFPKRREIDGRLLSTASGIGRNDCDGAVLRSDAEYTKRSPRFPGLSRLEGGSFLLVALRDSQAGLLSILRGLEEVVELRTVGGVHLMDEVVAVSLNDEG